MAFGRKSSEDGGSKKSKISLGRRKSMFIGLHAASHRLRFAGLDMSQPEGYILRLVERPLPSGLIVQGRVQDRANFTDELRVLVEEEKLLRARTVVAANVQSASVFVKRFTVKRASQEEVRRGLPSNQAIKAQLKDPENTVLQAALLDEGGSSDMMPVLAIVAKKDAIEPRQAAGIESGLLIEAVDIDALAIYNCFQHCVPEASKETMLLVHIGDEGALIIVSDSYGPTLVRPVTSGLEELVEEIAREQASFSAESIRAALWNGSSDAERDFGPGFSSWKAKLVDEIIKSVNSLSTKSSKPAAGYICGDGAIIPGLVDSLTTDLESLNIPIKLFNPLDHIAVDEGAGIANPSLGTGFTLTLGLALRQLGG